jgi:hypothetical protein
VKAFAIYMRCISLPLCGGLILAFYLSLYSAPKMAPSTILKVAAIKVARFPVYAYILQTCIPALKNLK